jgi:hypothetical protein
MLSARALCALLILAIAAQVAHGYGPSVQCGVDGIICPAKVKKKKTLPPSLGNPSRDFCKSLRNDTGLVDFNPSLLWHSRWI